MSPRWASYLVCLLGLPIYLWGIEGQRHVGALPADVSAHELRFPVRIEGALAETPEHLRSLIERYSPGRHVRLESGGATRVLSVAPAYSQAHHLINLISALCFWMVACFVFAERPERDPGRAFFLSTFCYGLAISVGTIAFPAAPRGLDALRPVVRLLCVALLPVLFVKMSLLFPRRRPSVDARPWILPALFLAAFGLASWHCTGLLRYFAAPTPEHWKAAAWSERSLDVFLIALVGAACLLMYQSGRRARLTREKQQLKWLWWGITVGITPYVFLHTLPKMLVGHELMPIHLTRVFALAVPIAFSFAAIKHKLLDIDVIIRRSLIYGVMAAVLAVVYMLFANLVGQWVLPNAPDSAHLVPIAAAVVSAMLFGPTRRWVGGWVDRTFFHIRYSHSRALRRFRVGIARPRSQRELAEFLRRFVTHMLAPKATLVIVRFGPEVFAAGDVDPLFAQRAIGFFDRVPERKDRVMASRDVTSMPEFETADFPTELSDAGFQLVQPLAAYGELHGLLLLGEKRSERRYIEEDLTLLSGVATAASAALERVNQAQRVAEERIVRERLDGINRMKSDFLSRVAHDLRTPVTSIDWSARNLLDGLAGPLREAQTEYLKAILASAIHLGRLVTNLLEISRLEDGDTAIELRPVSLASVAEEAVVGLVPIATAKDVRIVQCIDRGLTRVRGNHEKLVQVLVNLLENAIRYSPAGAPLVITVARAGTDCQQITVRDSGPGIQPGEEMAIFERFRQGAPSPHAQPQGFGLGLFVARAHVEAFSGRVSVTNHPEGGAEFAVLLRDWPPDGIAAG